MYASIRGDALPISCLIEVLTCTHELGEGPCQVGSLTGAVAS